MPRRAPWSEAIAARLEKSPDPKWAGALVKRILDGCHPRQRAFVEDPADLISGRVGRGGGKTTGGKGRFLIRMLTSEASCAYVATTKIHAEALMWEPLKKSCVNLGLQ